LLDYSSPTVPPVPKMNLAAENMVFCLLESQPRFGRYTLLYRFATGGMANLYTAKLNGTDGFEKIVAIKIMHQHLTRDPEFVQMFIDEARLAARINHSNVVQIFELGLVGGSHYIAMEYVEGESVLGLLRRTRPGYRTCAQVVANAAAGLHAAHELKDSEGQSLEVVHRDVSPDNILISYDGAVKVADFGVARARSSVHTTQDGTLKGKFSYMAPEQAMAMAVDRRTDIFSLGIVLYEMTTGRRLFKRPSEAEVLRAVVRCQVPPPSTQVPDYPKTLERVVMTALQRNPNSRFQTALELQEALARFLAEGGEPMLASTLGDAMSALFVDRKQHKRELLRKYRRGLGDCVPDLDYEVSSSSISMLVVKEPPPRLWLRLLLVAGVSAALSALAVLAYLLVPGVRGVVDRAGQATRVEPPRLRTWGQVTRPRTWGTVSRPAQVTIRIIAAPPTATIRVDGQPAANPCTVTRPRGDGQLPVEIAADGHHPRRFSVPLAADGRWEVRLEPMTATAPTPRAKRRPRRRKQRRRLADRDVLKNPYRRR
jgi:serine/threonine protein kinase